MRKTLVLVALVAMVAAVAVAGSPERVKSTTTPAPAQAGTGTLARAPQGTAWITYDDGTSDSDGEAQGFLSNAAVGNVFTPPGAWGTYYCDQISVFHASVNTGFSLSIYTNLSAGALQGNDFQNFAAVNQGANVWNLLTTAAGWLGNAANTWTAPAPAYIAGYQSGVDNIGLDSSGANGFAVTNYTGAGYTPIAFNAMLRARFNGASVPVELVGFSVE